MIRTCASKAAILQRQLLDAVPSPQSTSTAPQQPFTITGMGHFARFYTRHQRHSMRNEPAKEMSVISIGGLKLTRRDILITAIGLAVIVWFYDMAFHEESFKRFGTRKESEKMEEKGSENCQRVIDSD